MYAVQKAKEGEAAELVGKFETEAEAIRAAEAEAAEVDNDTEVTVINPQGDTIWDNEGDWRNAVRN